MSLFRILDDVYSFMLTLDVFADSPQGGWGGLATHSENGWWKEQDPPHDKPHRGGWGEKETNPAGVGAGLEPWNISPSSLDGYECMRASVPLPPPPMGMGPCRRW